MRQLSGGCGTRDRVFLMSIAPDCAKRGFRANFGIWWLIHHLKQILIKQDYQNTLKAINKQHYLNDLKNELDELM